MSSHVERSRPLSNITPALAIFDEVRDRDKKIHQNVVNRKLADNYVIIQVDTLSETLPDVSKVVENSDDYVNQKNTTLVNGRKRKKHSIAQVSKPPFRKLQNRFRNIQDLDDPSPFDMRKELEVLYEEDQWE